MSTESNSVPKSTAPSIALPNGNAYSWPEKYEAVQNYLVFGNMRTVAGVLRIPYETLVKWKATQWWKDYEEELKHATKVQLSHSLQTIVNRSLELVADRLENGNIVVDKKTGEQKRVPVGISDATKVADSLLHKKIQMDKKEKVEEVKDHTVKETLAMLAAEFAKMSRRDNNQKAEDITFIENTGE